MKQLNNYYIRTGLSLFAILATTANFGLLPKVDAGISDEAKIESSDLISDYSTKIDAIKVPFIENEGQLEDEIKYSAKIFPGQFFVTENKLEYIISGGKEEEQIIFDESFLDGKGGEIKFYPVGEDMAETKMSYYIGNDESKWRTAVPTFNTINIGEIYPNINIKLNAYGKNIEKLFYINPKGDPNAISIKIDNANLKIENSELVIETKTGKISFTKPIAYQEYEESCRKIDVEFTIKQDGSYGFRLGEYNNEKPLIIDPLVASTYIGKTAFGNDRGYAIAFDSTQSNIYVAGVEYSGLTNGLTTNRGVSGGASSAFVCRLNSSLSTLSACVTIGGQNSDTAVGLAVDSSNNVFITGSASLGFPTNGAVYDSNHGGSTDAYVAKFDSTLISSWTSTFLGGDSTAGSADYGTNLFVDSNNDVYVAGYTSSSDFETTSGAYDESHNGGADGFVVKLNNALSSLLISTFLGGTGNDYAYSILPENGGSGVYVDGYTASTNFPNTCDPVCSPYQSTKSSSNDIFILKLNNNLSTQLAFTHYGGSAGDALNSSQSLAIDASNNVYIGGYTYTSSGLATAGAYQTTSYSDPEGIVARFNSTLSSLYGATYLGSTRPDYVTGLSVDASGNVYVAGYTSGSNTTTNFPTTSGAFDEVGDGNSNRSDGFVSKISTVTDPFDTLSASTFIGGTENDQLYDVLVSLSGRIYITGDTSNAATDYPVVSGSYQTTHSKGSLYYDVALSEFTNDLSAGEGEPPEEVSIPEYRNIYMLLLTFGAGLVIIFIVRKKYMLKKGV